MFGANRKSEKPVWTAPTAGRVSLTPQYCPAAVLLANRLSARDVPVDDPGRRVHGGDSVGLARVPAREDRDLISDVVAAEHPDAVDVPVAAGRIGQPSVLHRDGHPGRS